MRIVVSAVVLVFAVSSAAATVIPVEAFRSIELHSGGHVVVRYGAVQRVSLVEGDPRSTQIAVRGQRLVIERNERAPHDHRMELEVVTPSLSRVAISNGGTIRALGAFPDQESIEVAIEQGGMIDIRAIAADHVEASVYSGGGIFVTSRSTLDASVESGGAITYWGSVQNVRKSVRDGGMVKRGRADEARKPIASMSRELAPLPPAPPIPPVPPVPPDPPQ